jgi:predicted MFS family arabinose efflux permease
VSDGTAHGGVLANRDFVKLWIGETVSLVGTQMTQLALPLVAIVTLQATAFEVGILNATRYAPVVVFSLLAGVWLDARRRRPTLIAADLAAAVLIGMIPVAGALGVLSIWLLCAIALLAAVPQVFFDIGVLSYLPSLVERRHLADANSKFQMSLSVASIAGPSLAGVLFGLLAAPVILAVNSASYLVSMAMLILIRRPEEAPQPPAERPSVARATVDGLRKVFGNAILRSLLLQSCMFNLAYNGLFTVFTVYAIRTLGLSATELGLVVGSAAVSAFFVATVANRITSALGLGRTLLLTTLGACGTPLLFLLPRDASPVGLVLLGACWAFYAANVTVYNIAAVTLRQVITPNRLMARMNGSYRLLVFGTGPLGALAGGVLGSALGLRPAMVIAAIALTTPAIWILFSPIFRLREMPAGPDEELAEPDGSPREPERIEEGQVT